ncbi:hypothetical protein XELAEV_18022639mg [Xenopus laevis]|uniref:Uncharacterized protein n=1 Tax=Xenopus laevis TaxID=8355 RepID=A0A974D538_XENLA|nr:hypothetical protein XELAEV_18022639mg [Xenopus laevis]
MVDFLIYFFFFSYLCLNTSIFLKDFICIYTFTKFKKFFIVWSTILIYLIPHTAVFYTNTVNRHFNMKHGGFKL